MIQVNRYTLANGLRIVHNEDDSTQMVALNLLYDVEPAMKTRRTRDLPICSST